MQRRLLTTGQAAELCSVTPDAVLKWIKAGRLDANRTAGGHYRVDPAELEKRDLLPRERTHRFCWDFRAKDGEIAEVCRTCLVHRARAERCYELAMVADGTSGGHGCCVNDCEDCEFFRHVVTPAAD
ncbi:MAG: helix-turn-helix domain-containing protein [Planctomycetota bacterium]